MPGGTRLDFDRIRPTTLRPLRPDVARARPSPGQMLELRFGFSLRGVEQAQREPSTPTAASGSAAFESRRANDLEGVAPAPQTDQRRHAVERPGRRSSPPRSTTRSSSPASRRRRARSGRPTGPFVFDICTMWDIYRTQLPLITALLPSRPWSWPTPCWTICEEEGNLPIGYRMARGADRFSRQGSALAHTFLADLCQLGVPGIDWDWALCHMHTDLRRDLRRGLPPARHGAPDHPHARPRVRLLVHRESRSLRRRRPPGDTVRALAGRWVNAFDPDDGLLLDSTYYEGGKWNYSFRLLHDMQARIALAGGDERVHRAARPVLRFRRRPRQAAGRAAGCSRSWPPAMRSNRFEGLNNEPDMEAPWAYHYAGRPDRTAEVVHAAVNNMFGSAAAGCRATTTPAA